MSSTKWGGRQPDEGEESPAREGTFDAQLSFPAPFVEAPEPLATIIKRDGREVPFKTAKIAEAIYRAAESVGAGDRDLAESLAAGVAIYLAKQRCGQPPTVEQVNDAVERVLIELGHGRTALAYARYRDKRARLRAFRKGNLQALLREMQDAGPDSSLPAEEGTLSLFVRTSSETLAAWDLERIVDALIQETGMERARANLIALEVQDQILAAGVKTLTAPLVRELVDAKLIEHGLEEHRRRHARLGVPLFDAEQIICLPNRDERALFQDPQTTDLDLAERVKREFALSHVYDRLETDAHLRGDVHIHDLGFVDRLHSCRVSLGYVATFGMPQRGLGRAAPPRNAAGLLNQIGRFSAALRAHFVRGITWRAANLFLAPYGASRSREALDSFIRLILIGLTHRSLYPRARAGVAEVELTWDVPVSLRSCEVPGHHEPYAAFQQSAQRLASAVLDLYKEGGLGEDGEETLGLGIRVSDETFNTPGHEDFLLRVAELVSSRRAVRVWFDREPEPIPLWQLHRVSVGQVSLNLARAAYRARNEQGVLDAIERLVGVGARAHVAKRDFIEKLLAVRSFGPLAFLTAEYEGIPLCDISRASYRVGAVALDECVEAIVGRQPHESPEAFACAVRVLTSIRSACEQWSARTGLNLDPVFSPELPVARRFAALDLRAFPDLARAHLQTDPITQDLFYTARGGLRETAGLSHFERVRLESAFHEVIVSDAAARLRMPDTELAPESIVNFIRKAYHHTSIRCLAFEA